MKHLWTILCGRLLVDEQSKNASLIDIIEELKVKEEFLKDKKQIPVFLNLVSLWSIENEIDTEQETKVLIEFNDPSQNKLSDFEFSFTPPKRKKRIRTNIQFPKMDINGSGTYTIKIKQGDKIVAEVPLEILIV